MFPSIRPIAHITSQDIASENDAHGRKISSSIELPGIAQMKQEAGLALAPYDSARPRTLLPSILSKSPPGRSSTLPPIQRRDKANRPRKSSVTQNARRPQHERKRSRGEHVRTMSYDGRKAYSAEPTSSATALGKRWEDLIDAATTATEVDDDRTPVRQKLVWPPNHTHTDVLGTSVSTKRPPCFPSALSNIALSVLPSLSASKCPDPSVIRPRPLPERREWRELSHRVARPGRFITVLGIAECPDLLRGMSGNHSAAQRIRLYGMHLRHLQGVRGRATGGARPAPAGLSKM